MKGQEPKGELTPEATIAEWGAAEDEVRRILEEWRQAMGPMETNTGELNIIAEHYMPLFEEAQQKANEAYERFKALQHKEQ